MRKLILTVCTLVALNAASAQDFKHSVSLSFGAATPLNDFASTDLNNANAGGASNGLCIDLEYKGFLFHDKIGVLALIKNQFNGVDKDYIALQTPPNMISTVTAWSLSGYMAGAFYEVKVGEKGFIHPKVAFGILDANTPEWKIENNGAIMAKLESANGIAFSSLFGADFGWNLGNFKLQAQYDFILANPQFNTRAVDGSGALIGTSTINQKMQTYNVKLAVGYNFGS
jgi:hypothetical protein